jgi:hypothetical protein
MWQLRNTHKYYLFRFFWMLWLKLNKTTMSLLHCSCFVHQWEISCFLYISKSSGSRHPVFYWVDLLFLALNNNENQVSQCTFTAFCRLNHFAPNTVCFKTPVGHPIVVIPFFVRYPFRLISSHLSQWKSFPIRSL